MILWASRSIRDEMPASVRLLRYHSQALQNERVKIKRRRKKRPGSWCLSPVSTCQRAPHVHAFQRLRPELDVAIFDLPLEFSSVAAMPWSCRSKSTYNTPPNHTSRPCSDLRGPRTANCNSEQKGPAKGTDHRESKPAHWEAKGPDSTCFTGNSWAEKVFLTRKP